MTIRKNEDRPAYAHSGSKAETEARPAAFVDFPGGIYRFGNVEGGWCWDNELGFPPFITLQSASTNIR